jgi:hypothetical protein
MTGVLIVLAVDAVAVPSISEIWYLILCFAIQFFCTHNLFHSSNLNRPE